MVKQSLKYAILLKFNTSIKLTYLLFFAVMLYGCNKIETGDSLTKADKDYINSIILLDKDEYIYNFYSNYTLKTLGNFYTNKRMVEYAIYPEDTSRNKIHSAFYDQITAIDTVYNVEATYVPYLAVTKVQGDTMEEFNVYFDGKKPELKAVFEQAINIWKKAKKNNKQPNIIK